MNEQPLPIGSHVFVWARPEPDLILLFGEGTFEGMNHFNGNNFPVVKLSDGRELTVHYQGVYVGEKGSVQRTCEKFKGDIIEFDIQDFLQGRRPSYDQRKSKRPEANGMAASPESLPEPKTVTDKMMHLKREIEYEQSKIKLAQTLINDSNKKISEKRVLMATMKEAVLKEVSELSDIPDDAILAAAEKIRSSREAASVVAMKPHIVDTVVNSENTMTIKVVRDEDVHYQKLATED